MWSVVLALWAPPAWSQVWVAPQRPGQSVVRNTRQDWQTIDLLVGEEINDQKAGGVRLFFYVSELQTAERAAAQIEAAYRELCDKFAYVPKKRFDYVLYATYQEFLKTNLFPLQEGVLGVTATQSLHMAIPYFGDHQTFQHTSTHELAHEFMLQRVRAAAKETRTWRDPLDAFPLWFVEGLAEYQAMGPISGENLLRVRDLATNPDLYQGFGLLSFWDDWPGYTLWTYQAGHARITFLEEEYGAGILNRVLAYSPAVVSEQGLAARIRRFEDLIEELTGDDPTHVAARYDAWIKRRTYSEYLEAEQTVADLEPLKDVVGVPLALDASADGNLVAYRSIQPDTGRSVLYVTDPREASSTVRIAADVRPGTESLHPIDPRNFDVTDDRLVYVAEVRGRDQIVTRQLEHAATSRPPEPLPEDEEPFPLPLKGPTEDVWDVKLRRGARHRVRLDDADIVAASSVAVAPAGDRFAVIGLGTDGQRDLYVVTPSLDRRRDRHPAVVRVTRDVYGERDVAWGPDGLVFSSDASPDGTMQLFRVDPDSGAPPVRLTEGAADHVSPAVLADGTIVYSSVVDDRAALFALRDGQTRKLTDLAVGAFEPAPGPGDDVWALVLRAGRLRPMRIDATGGEPAPDVTGGVGPPGPIDERALEGAADYRPLAIRNWGIDGGFAAIGAGVGGVYGQLYLSFSDRLRDHGLIVIAQANGNPKLTDGQLLYLDESGRVTFGWGVFHDLRFRIDQTVPEAEFLFQSGERYYGSQVIVRYPFDRYFFVQGGVSAGGVSYFVLPGLDELLADPVANGSGLDLFSLWQDRNPHPRFQTEGTLRLGLDTIRFHPKTGPLAGTSILVEGNLAVQPFDGQTMASARLDGQHYIPVPLVSGANLGLRASAGTSAGGPYAMGYWLSSYDTLRAYNFGDLDLLGRHFWFTNAELQLPLDAVVRLAVASGIEGVVGVDFGAVSDDMDALWDERVLDVALGTNFILGPLVLRLHFARALDIGAPLPDTATPWVTNFSLSWLSQ